MGHVISPVSSCTCKSDRGIDVMFQITKQLQPANHLWWCHGDGCNKNPGCHKPPIWGQYKPWKMVILRIVLDAIGFPTVIFYDSMVLWSKISQNGILLPGSVRSKQASQANNSATLPRSRGRKLPIKHIYKWGHTGISTHIYVVVWYGCPPQWRIKHGFNGFTAIWMANMMINPGIWVHPTVVTMRIHPSWMSVSQNAMIGLCW